MPRKEKSQHQKDVEQYVRDVTSGKIVSGKLQIAACKRYRADIRNQKKLGIYLDVDRGNRVIECIQLLQHTTGEFAGRPFVLEPWQKFVVWNVFAWRRIKDNFRRFRDVFLTMGRGNGKSPMAASFLFVLMAADDPAEQRAQLYTAATERDQARIVFDEVKQYIQANPQLDSRFQSYKDSLTYSPLGSVLKPLGKDAHSKDGFNIHAFVADETHAWKEEHRPLMEKLETAMGKRRQPLSISITTAGDENSKLWREQHDYSRQVVQGVIDDPAHFSFICEIDPTDDPLDPSVWAKANPNLGISVKHDYLARAAKKAASNPSDLLTFTRYHCNRLVTSTQKVIDPKLWATGGGYELQFGHRQKCFGGIDIGWRDDLAAWAKCFPMADEDGDYWYEFEVHAWIPDECKRDLNREPWYSWIQAGWLTVTEGNTTDIESIRQQIVADRDEYDLKTVALDPNNARQLGQQLLNEDAIDVFEFFQTCRKYNEPLNAFLGALAEGRILHGDNPLLGWCADNLVVRSDSQGNRMPAKQKSADKIDLMVAVIMAFSEAIFDEQNGSAYEHGGIKTL